jgi:hypothetical protein
MTGDDDRLRHLIASIPTKPETDWIDFYSAAGEVAQGIGGLRDAAVMTLYGLCVAGDVRTNIGDQQRQSLRPDRWASGDHWGPDETFVSILVSVTDLRDWISEQRQPQTSLQSKKEQEIERLLKAGHRPGAPDMPWKKFSKELQKAVGDPKARGFSVKQLRRDVGKVQARMGHVGHSLVDEV